MLARREGGMWNLPGTANISGSLGRGCEGKVAKDVVEKDGRRLQTGPCVLLKEFGFYSF